MGMIYYIIGKSATGKDTMYEKLLQCEELRLKRMILYTTRPIREGETDGKEYFFVDDEKLKQMRNSGRIIELREYHTVHGVWTYFTADDGQICPEDGNYLGIGTLESFQKLKEYYGEKFIFPLYLEVEDGERLSRALKRERKQNPPKYEELCRRFLADQEDFSEERIIHAGIWRRFQNNNLEECYGEILRYISSTQ